LRPEICSTGSPSCSPRVFTVGPGDISAYGTGMNTPAHRSAISIRVEASIVAVRRGMSRQYGTALSAHRQGAWSGAGTGLLHRLAKTGVSVQFGTVAAYLPGSQGPAPPQ